MSFNGNLQPSSDAGEDLTTKGDIHGYSTENTRVPIGTDEYVLTADSTNSYGFAWKEAAGGAISEYVAFATDSTWATYTVPTSATVSSTAADAFYDIQTSTSQTFTASGGGSSGGRVKCKFEAGNAALGKSFVQIQNYVADGGGGATMRFYFCKGDGSGGQQYTSWSPSMSTTFQWRTANSSDHALLTIEEGDYFMVGNYNQYETNYAKGTTSAVTGSQIYTSSGGYNCGGTDTLDGNGQFALKIKETFAGSNLTVAAEGASWVSTSEANANMVLDYGSSKIQSGCAYYYNSASTFVQILIQSSDNGTDWTTQRTINATQLTADSTNYIRYNVVKARYIRVYVNDGGTARVLAGRCDGYIKDELQNHTHLQISTTSTTINLDGTTP